METNYTSGQSKAIFTFTQVAEVGILVFFFSSFSAALPPPQVQTGH